MGKRTIKVGILGFGVVGKGVYAVLKKNENHVMEKAGVPIEVRKIAEPRPVSLPKGLVTKKALEVVADPEIDVIVETIGGVGAAKKLVLAAIEKGKHVVTSNKELIAKFGTEIFARAAKNGVAVLFEAAVAGAIPIIWNLRECLASNEISEVYGIVNGTTNYILSKMTEEGMEFSEALKEARKKGFAEANPSMDIQGQDAAYKAAILAGVAFGAQVDPKQVYAEGISKIKQEDIAYASEIGYVIKLLAILKKSNGKLEVRVHPTLVPMYHPLASVEGAFNAISVKGNAIGEEMFYGEGAGSLPTGSAIVGDIINLVKHPDLIVQNPAKKVPLQPIGEVSSRYYVRMQVADCYGVLSKISHAFASEKVSIQTVLQQETTGKIATLVIILHDIKGKNLNNAIRKIKRLSVVKAVCNVVRVGI